MSSPRSLLSAAAVVSCFTLTASPPTEAGRPTAPRLQFKIRRGMLGRRNVVAAEAVTRDGKLDTTFTATSPVNEKGRTWFGRRTSTTSIHAKNRTVTVQRLKSGQVLVRVVPEGHAERPRVQRFKRLQDALEAANLESARPASGPYEHTVYDIVQAATDINEAALDGVGVTLEMNTDRVASDGLRREFVFPEEGTIVAGKTGEIRLELPATVPHGDTTYGAFSLAQLTGRPVRIVRWGDEQNGTTHEPRPQAIRGAIDRRRKAAPSTE